MIKVSAQGLIRGGFTSKFTHMEVSSCGLLNWSLNIGYRSSSDSCHNIIFIGELTTWQLTSGEQMSKEGRQGGSERDWFGSQSILKLETGRWFLISHFPKYVNKDSSNNKTKPPQIANIPLVLSYSFCQK